MKIRSIGQLIGNFVSASSQGQETTTAQQSNTEETQGEAVSVSAEIGASNATDRAAYVADIAARVKNQTYNVSSKSVAESLARDLF